MQGFRERRRALSVGADVAGNFRPSWLTAECRAPNAVGGAPLPRWLLRLSAVELPLIIPLSDTERGQG